MLVLHFGDPVGGKSKSVTSSRRVQHPRYTAHTPTPVGTYGIMCQAVLPVTHRRTDAQTHHVQKNTKTRLQLFVGQHPVRDFIIFWVGGVGPAVIQPGSITAGTDHCHGQSEGQRPQWDLPRRWLLSNSRHGLGHVISGTAAYRSVNGSLISMSRRVISLTFSRTHAWSHGGGGVDDGGRKGGVQGGVRFHVCICVVARVMC